MKIHRLTTLHFAPQISVMRKSSFGQFSGRLSSGPLRVKNDGEGHHKSSLGSQISQEREYSGASSSARPRQSQRNSNYGPYAGLGARNTGIGGHGSSMGRSSMDFRVSGIGVRARSDVPKDPRPISDKSYQHRCIRKLFEFLTDNKYPHSISQKMLLSPPSKEFFNVFEFIYCHIDPAFRLIGKMDEKIPRMLKMLGYPFQISKSSMQAVGTPHTWPYLLAALIWLVELVKFTQGLQKPPLLDHLIFPPDEDDFDSVPEDKIRFQYITQTYAAFLDGEDDYEAYDEELRKVLQDKYLGQSGGLEAVRSANQRMVEEIDHLDQEMARVGALQEQQEIMLLDERKFQDYLSEVENVIRRHQQLQQDSAEEHDSLQQQLQSVITKNQHMQAVYEQQDLTPGDVERLRAARQELQQQEEALEKEVEAIDSDIWREEMSLARHHEQLNNSLAEYSKLARALQLIPSTSEVANGINFELTAFDGDTDNKFENVIKPALTAVKKRGMEAIQDLEATRLRQERSLEETNDQLSELNDEISQLEKEVKCRDEEIVARKQLYQRDIDALQATADNLKQEIRTQTTSSQMSLQDAERELRETYSWAEQRKAELKRKELEYVVFMTKVCNLVADHKDHVQEQLKSHEKDMVQLLAVEQERTQRLDVASQKLQQQLAHQDPN